MQQFLQRMLEEEVDGLLGRARFDVSVLHPAWDARLTKPREKGERDYGSGDGNRNDTSQEFIAELISFGGTGSGFKQDVTYRLVVDTAP